MYVCVGMCIVYVCVYVCVGMCIVYVCVYLCVYVCVGMCIVPYPKSGHGVSVQCYNAVKTAFNTCDVF